MQAFLAAWDAGKADQAYAMLSPENRQMMPFADFDAMVQKFHGTSGALIARRGLKSSALR